VRTALAAFSPLDRAPGWPPRHIREAAPGWGSWGRESYETYFDRFELLLALTFADFRDPTGDVWGPPGRFSYKQRYSESPMALLIAEATEQGSRWEPLGTGLFGGKSERFLKVASSYKQLLERHGRW
jgi:hypothetical protein